MLKKWISILFLSVYLLTATEFNELFKLPLLVEHFMQHNEGNKHVDFWEFLCIHYSNNNIKDADYDEDMKLPFKSQSHFEKNNTSLLEDYLKQELEDRIEQLKTEYEQGIIQEKARKESAIVKLKALASSLLSSTLIFNNFTLFSFAISSRTGVTILQGPHHSAQKSSSTGLSDFSTSWSKDASLTCLMPALMTIPSIYRWVALQRLY